MRIRFQAAVIVLLTVSLLLPTLAAARRQAPLSDAMKSLLQQANSQDLSRFDTNVDKLVNQNPMVFASILGVTLQRQMKYAMANPSYNVQYARLRVECTHLLELVAREKGYQNPTDNSPMTINELGGEFEAGLQGRRNGFFIEKYGFDPATVGLPMLLGQVPPSQQGGGSGPLYKVKRREKPNNEITIGGVTAAASQPSVTDQLKDPRMEFPENIIQGTWVSTKDSKRLVFQRQGNAYLSQISYIDRYTKNPISVTYVLTSSKFMPRNGYITPRQRRYTGIMQGTEAGAPFKREMKLDVSWDNKEKGYKIYTGFLEPSPDHFFIKR